MVIRDHDLFHGSYPSAQSVKGLTYGSVRSLYGATIPGGGQALPQPHVNGAHAHEDADGQASVAETESVEEISEQDSLTSVE